MNVRTLNSDRDCLHAECGQRGSQLAGEDSLAESSRAHGNGLAIVSHVEQEGGTGLSGEGADVVVLLTLGTVSDTIKDTSDDAGESYSADRSLNLLLKTSSKVSAEVIAIFCHTLTKKTSASVDATYATIPFIMLKLRIVFYTAERLRNARRECHKNSSHQQGQQVS